MSNVETSSSQLPALLHPDGMVMFAGDDEMMGRALEKLDEWCMEWTVRVNVDKCGIMHVRKV